MGLKRKRCPVLPVPHFLLLSNVRRDVAIAGTIKCCKDHLFCRGTEWEAEIQAGDAGVVADDRFGVKIGSGSEVAGLARHIRAYPQQQTQTSSGRPGTSEKCPQVDIDRRLPDGPRLDAINGKCVFGKCVFPAAPRDGAASLRDRAAKRGTLLPPVSLRSVAPPRKGMPIPILLRYPAALRIADGAEQRCISNRMPVRTEVSYTELRQMRRCLEPGCSGARQCEQLGRLR
jgi:hypothetical protein